MKKRNNESKVITNENGAELENLGLDADQSSEGNTLKNRLNDDNDRVTGNPGGENDIRGEDSHARGSALDQK